MSKDITNKANEDQLNTLHQMIAKDLIRRIQSGEATIQDLNAAIKFLKDNDVVADIAVNANLPLLTGAVESAIKVEALPFPEDDEGEEDED